ncbi:hypothetical protein [Bradyrhizobium sp. STM 3566]|uniref:hypothetical protein n=1 Tax=Bradyrhizobium sp. STM 3566 TaxID=578928 RepID=UPI00388E0FB4
MQVEATVARDHTDATVIRAVGKAASANREVILLQSTSIQLLLTSAIERAKVERTNSTSVPELEAILLAAQELHRSLLQTESPADVIGEKAITFKRGVANWYTRDHVSILNRTFDRGMFVAAIGLCVWAGVIPSAIAAFIVHPKESVELVKELNKLFGKHGPDGE